ncbi:MAG: hypothetical protein K5767_01465 [Clostridia bacterium]|nr:hypothetical protein [Clostridia bacterium]
MNKTVFEWDNDKGIRIPAVVSESLNLRADDRVSLVEIDGELFLKKEQSTMQLFEEFYGKPFDEITIDDLGHATDVD